MQSNVITNAITENIVLFKCMCYVLEKKFKLRFSKISKTVEDLSLLNNISSPEVHSAPLT